MWVWHIFWQATWSPVLNGLKTEAICLVYEPPFSDVHRFYKICISTYFLCKNKHINGLVSEFSKQVLGEMKEHHGAPGKNAPDSKQSPAVMSHLIPPFFSHLFKCHPHFRSLSPSHYLSFSDNGYACPKNTYLDT